MTEAAPVVFLPDVDNTLLDNDRIVTDLKAYLARSGMKASSATGKSSRAGVRSSGTPTTSGPCSVTGPRTSLANKQSR
jgi:hypothetical protein